MRQRVTRRGAVYFAIGKMKILNVLQFFHKFEPREKTIT